MLTTARSTAGGIADFLATELRSRADETPVRSALVLGNPRGVRQFTDVEHGGGVLVGTKGLWQGVDVSDEQRLRLVWINKLPFAPFAAPVIEARRAAITMRAEAAHADDPDAVATEHYYLPLAALQLRQAVGRLIERRRAAAFERLAALESIEALAAPARTRGEHLRLATLDHGLRTVRTELEWLDTVDEQLP